MSNVKDGKVQVDKPFGYYWVDTNIESGEVARSGFSLGADSMIEGTFPSKIEGFEMRVIALGAHESPLPVEKTPAPEPFPLRFPVALRKMWSGREVQTWLDQLPLLYSAPPAGVPLGYRLVQFPVTAPMVSTLMKHITNSPKDADDTTVLVEACNMLVLASESPNAADYQSDRDMERYAYLLECEFQAARAYLPNLDEKDFKSKLRQKHSAAVSAAKAVSNEN